MSEEHDDKSSGSPARGETPPGRIILEWSGSAQSRGRPPNLEISDTPLPLKVAEAAARTAAESAEADGQDRVADAPAQGDENIRTTEDGSVRVTEDGSVRVTEDGSPRIVSGDVIITTEDGNPIVTENGDAIAAELQVDARTTLQQRLDRLAQIVERAHGLAEVLEAERHGRLGNHPPKSEEIPADDLPQYSLRDVEMMLLGVRIMRGRVDGSLQPDTRADAVAVKAVREAEPSVSAFQQWAITIIGGTVATVLGAVIVAHIGDGGDQLIRDAQELHALVAAILQDFTQLIMPGGSTL